MTCRTVADAWQAGWDEPCEHGVLDLADCGHCALTMAEISRLVLLHRPYLVAQTAQHRTAA